MRKAEQKLWDALRSRLKKSVMLHRIENVILAGTPDVYCCNRNGTSIWLELKATTKPRRPTTPLLGDRGLRASQIVWLLTVREFGAKAYVLIRADGATKEVLLVPADVARTLNLMTFDEILATPNVLRGWEEIELLLTNV